MFLVEQGLTQAQMDYAAASCVWFPSEIPMLEIRHSVRHGKGIHARRDIARGENMWARHSGVWSAFGRFANHSKRPNMNPFGGKDEMVFIVNEDVPEGVELLVNYRDVKKALA